MLLSFAVVAAVVVFAVLFSSATFTAESGSAANDVSAGDAGLDVTPNDTIIDATGMKPNSVRTGDVTVTNTAAPAIVSVEVKNVASEPALAAALTFKIAKQGDPGVVPYEGPLGGAGRVDLGTHQPGQATSWTLTLSLPSTVDPVLSEKQLAAEFHWEARTP